MGPGGVRQRVAAAQAVRALGFLEGMARTAWRRASARGCCASCTRPRVPGTWHALGFLRPGARGLRRRVSARLRRNLYARWGMLAACVSAWLLRKLYAP